MTTQKLLWQGTAIIAACLMMIETDALARGGLGGVGGGGGRGGGGGGARPSMGGGGGGMSRPSPNISRPSPNISRPPSMPTRPSVPNVSRPSPNVSRPSPNVSRPSPNVSRPVSPGIGSFNPGGGRPSTLPSRPSLPGGGNVGGGNIGNNRPSITPPGNLNPVRPSLPGGGNVANRPSLPMGGAGNVTRPNLPGGSGIGTRPVPERPSIGNLDRPTTLPARPGTGNITGNRPGVGNLPDIGNRPGIGDRPDIGNRPGIDNRPGIGTRPTVPNRPNIPDRPNIGNGNNVVGGGNVINRPGGINVNRPGSGINIGNVNIGNNINRPGWGLPSTLPANRPWHDNQWSDRWHDHCINDHYRPWYNGCWHGGWGANWYTPLVWGTYGWGAGAWWTSSSWGYGPAYTNPYYDSSATYAYDYSQPVVTAMYATTDETGAAVPLPQPDENQQAMMSFDAGLAAFKEGGYVQAMVNFDNALRKMPNDPVLHEVRALTLFALGRYKEAAVTLNSLLASSPGMDWTSMSALYGNDVDAYTTQLRKLEDHVRSNQQDAAAIFVLAYHYLVVGQNDSAIRALQAVVELQPKDGTARQLLKALSPPEADKPPSTSPAPRSTDPLAPAAEAAPTTDLVGKWAAKNEQVAVELTVTADNDFTWKATPTGQPAVEVKGKIAATADSLALESPEQGTMVGAVKSGGADQFTFTMASSNDAGLAFTRVK